VLCVFAVICLLHRTASIMAEVPEQLATALADRYRIERRLGEGGMATVYLAEDLKHERKVPAGDQDHGPTPAPAHSSVIR
jgi:hypothetical protein